MLLYGVSADLHDEYFSIILMLISSHYMANYGSDPIWFTNLMVCVRIFLLAWVRTSDTIKGGGQHTLIYILISFSARFMFDAFDAYCH